MTERERQVMKKLKEVVDRQRDEIRAKDRELTLKNEDIEAVKSHVLAEQILFSGSQCTDIISRKQEEGMSLKSTTFAGKKHYLIAS